MLMSDALTIALTEKHFLLSLFLLHLPTGILLLEEEERPLLPLSFIKPFIQISMDF